jgi:type IV pilus assembly protein PilQ
MSSMLGSITDRFRFASLLSLSAAIAIGINACAGSTTGQAGATASQAAIGDVVVESDSGVSRVKLLGLEDSVFTAYQQTEPDRVIVDLAGVDAGEMVEPIAVYDGTIHEIAVVPSSAADGEVMTRVEVSLAVAVDYDVRPEDEALLIEVVPLAEMALEGDATEGTDASSILDDDPWAAATDADSQEGEAWEDAEEIEPMVVAPATTLQAISAQRVGDGLMIDLQGDGTVESAVTFTLEDPARLVVDLPALKNEVEQLMIELDAPNARSVRIGSHPDKVRIVVDAGSADEPFDGRRVIPTPTGMIIALGSGADLEQAVAAASAAPAEPMEPEEAEEIAAVLPEDADAEPMPDAEVSEEETAVSVAAVDPESLVTIYGVEFDIQDEQDRVVVLAEHPVDYLIYEPDPETVVLSIQRAVIDPEAAIRIAPDPGGPVSLVTAFDQPDVSVPEVRVVVKRAVDLKPEVSRRGALLVLDFPRSGGLAATPPILTERGVEIAQLEPDAAPSAGEAEMVTASASEVLPVVVDEQAAAALPPAALAPAAPIVPEPAAAGLEMNAAPAALDAPASIAILNEGGLMDGKEYVGRRISLDFKEVDIADVLRLIAEVSDLNVIAGDEVKGAVTIRLVDVPWDQALDVILLTKGLGFVRIGNVLRIAATDVLSQEEELRLQERRAKEKLEDLVVKLQPVNYADVGDVSGMVTQLLTPRGSVNTDSRTNTLIIKDIPSVIDEATALVKAVDTMTPQVMIESKIIEAGLEFTREFGALWSFGTNPENTTLGGRDYIFTEGMNELGSQIAVGNPITSFPTGLMNLSGRVLDSKFDYEVMIQAAEVNGDGKVISSPRVVTLDNSEAQIEQGVSIPFQTFENGDAQLEFVDAVLKLKVTPHITSDKSIIMKIQVSRNAPDDSVFTLTGSPAIAKNQVKTETLVKDGQTLVLGGIYVVDKSERASRVPYLHKIPFVGLMFKSNEVSDSRKELLIFVTPRIVQTTEAAS